MNDIVAGKIFDALARASELIHRDDANRQRLAELQKRSREVCGNCKHWMKRPQCPREPGIGSGKPGPSISGRPCDKFTRTADAEIALKELHG